MLTDVRSPTVRAPVLLAAGGVAAQLVYPLTSGTTRDALTPAIVILLTAAVVGHVAITRGGPRAILVLAATAVPAFVVEAVGVRTGVPFGAYRYTGALGPHLLDVPLIVPLAWTMLAWPAAIAARTLTTGRLRRVLVGAWALTAADLFLDPQLVASGYWRWTHPNPHLPGMPTVPLTNLGGWLLLSLLLSAVVQLVVDRADPGHDSGHDAGHDDRLPHALYVWLWAGWTVALPAFLGLGGAAGWGAVGMGVVAVPLLLRMVQMVRC